MHFREYWKRIVKHFCRETECIVFHEIRYLLKEKFLKLKKNNYNNKNKIKQKSLKLNKCNNFEGQLFSTMFSEFYLGHIIVHNFHAFML